MPIFQPLKCATTPGFPEWWHTTHILVVSLLELMTFIGIGTILDTATYLKTPFHCESFPRSQAEVDMHGHPWTWPWGTQKAVRVSQGSGVHFAATSGSVTETHGDCQSFSGNTSDLTLFSASAMFLEEKLRW